jgi:hypothetical protein
MSNRCTLTRSVLATAAALVAPALADSRNGSQYAPDQGMGMGRMDHGMMSRGMMSGGMMGGGCAEMVQSMNGESERPNSQWRSSHQSGRAMPN